MPLDHPSLVSLECPLQSNFSSHEYTFKISCYFPAYNMSRLTVNMLIYNVKRVLLVAL